VPTSGEKKPGMTTTGRPRPRAAFSGKSGGWSESQVKDTASRQVLSMVTGEPRRGQTA
jgi:hypothetical protein